MSSRQFTKQKPAPYGAVFDSDVTKRHGHAHAAQGGRLFRADSDGDMDGNMSTDDGMSDSEVRTSGTDEFGGKQNYYQQKGTGRQRKKVASRGKGSEFQAKRKKRRVYACCIGSEIDTIQLVEFFKSAPPDSAIARANWSTQMYTDTLRIYRNSILVRTPSKTALNKPLSEVGNGEEEPVFYSYATGESRGLAAISDTQRDAVMKDLSAKFHDPYCKEIFVFGKLSIFMQLRNLTLFASRIWYCSVLGFSSRGAGGTAGRDPRVCVQGTSDDGRDA